MSGEEIEEVENGKENGSRTANEGGRGSNVADNVTAGSCHVVDLSGVGESDNVERVCRICHFGSNQTPNRESGEPVNLELIEIGCKCKNELGLAHFHCAEAWFKPRRNKVCEICGYTAMNVAVRLMEERSQVTDISPVERRIRGIGQLFCFFMLFLLGVVMLHWFFQKI